MNKKKVIITLTCIIVVGLGALGARKYMSGLDAKTAVNNDKRITSTSTGGRLDIKEFMSCAATEKAYTVNGVDLDSLMYAIPINEYSVENDGVAEAEAKYMPVMYDGNICGISHVWKNEQGETVYDYGEPASEVYRLNEFLKKNDSIAILAVNQVLYAISPNDFTVLSGKTNYGCEMKLNAVRDKLSYQKVRFADAAEAYEALCKTDFQIQAESLTSEEQAYIADMDKKLGEKYDISVKDNVTAYMGFTSAEVNGQLKTDVLEFFLNDFTQCEIPKESPEVLVGNWAVQIGNKIFTESGYYHYVDDEFVYFKVYTDGSPDDFKLYKVNRNLEQSIGERLFKHLHKTN